MDKIFFEGLATGNFRRWKHSQFSQWKRLIGDFKHLGVEIESTWPDDKRVRSNLKKRLQQLECVRSFSDLPEDNFVRDYIHCSEFEIHRLFNITNPIELYKNINSAITILKEYNINMYTSMHLNIVGDINYTKCILVSKSLNLLDETIYSDYSRHFDYKVGYYLHINHDFSNNEYNECYDDDKIMRRIENKRGIASPIYIDWIRQFICNIVIVKHYIKLRKDIYPIVDKVGNYYYNSVNNCNLNEMIVKYNALFNNCANMLDAKLSNIDNNLLKFANPNDKLFAQKLQLKNEKY
jgi:hypothetical protein